MRCLGGKFLHIVNASAPASMWMVRDAISSTRAFPLPAATLDA